MNKKVKILYFVDRMLRGGIQSLVVEIVKNIDKENFQIDFLLLDDGKTYELEDELKEMNCNVYKLKNVWINTPFDYIKYCKEMNKFFKTIGKDYDIVHLHSSSKNFMVLYYAQKYGIKVRIAHSHNTDFQTKNKIKILVGNCFKHFLKKYATNYMACSKDAGKWLFGSNVQIDILNNAIDVEKFNFSEKQRKIIRERYNILDGDIVCGNVGRFVAQKNHQFLLDIFSSVYQKDKRYKLLLIGSGTKEEEEKLKEIAKANQIEKAVIFAGFQENANLYFNAMDLFVFPSKFEGLGIVVIEAQANGLKCIISDNIPDEVKITKNVKAISLTDRNKWIDSILSIEKIRTNNLEDINNKGYNINQEIKKLEQYYKFEKIKKYSN